MTRTYNKSPLPKRRRDYQPPKKHQLSKKHHHHHHSPDPFPQTPNKPTFPSYLDTPNLSPKTKLLCEILAKTHSLVVEETLNDTGVRVTQEDVEDVLKLCYEFPGAAVKFFRWAGRQLKEDNNNSPYAWNLVVDLLGKNCFFDAMWDAVKSMSRERLLSLATFASVFASYVVANRVEEAIMAFEVMNQYGIPRDIVALNTLLSAICRDGETADAVGFLYGAKDKIRPDNDTYAILLEGWEHEGNVACARRAFDEMVNEIGWDPVNVPAYDSFLITLLKGPNGIHEALDYFETLKANRCYPGIKFLRLALDECFKNQDARAAEALWEVMVRRVGLQANTDMCNLMISLHCCGNNVNEAKRMLDEMVYNGAFPNSQTYNMLFKMLIKNRKLQEASVLFSEMTKNECVLDRANCCSAVRFYLDLGEDPYFAIKVWKFMIENYHSGLEDTGNVLIAGLRDLNRVPEAVKYAEDMISRGIKLKPSLLSKLKESLIQSKKEYMYDELLRKSKTR